MFENLSPREKMLAMVVGSLAPIMILFFGFMWFMDRYDTNSSEIDDLMSQIEIQEEKTRQGILAAQRQRYYRKTSLPAIQGRAKNAYKAWLDHVVLEEAGMTYDGVRFKEAGGLEFERDPVAIRSAMTLRPKATLPQLIKFLHAFYSADHLHRINKLSIKPVSKSNRGKAPILTGELQLDIEVEMLSLVDGPERMESFPVWENELPELDEYSQRILSRNIFGPANNAPAFKKPRKLEFTIAKSKEDADGKYETIQVEATDADADDLLAFELFQESGADESIAIELGDQPRTASKRKISLRIPKQHKATRIPISMGVVDDGMPAKSNEIKFTVVFKKPTVKPKKPDPVLVDLATLSFVKGLMKGVDGRWTALVFVKSDPHKLAAGDSLELGKKEWKVVEVSKERVTFEIDGKRKTLGVDNALSDSSAESKNP
jgi:hypothetical protein